jgi:carboxyl-terminal processing protease
MLPKALAALTVCLSVCSWADEIPTWPEAPVERIDVQHGFAGQPAVTIENDGKMASYPYQLDAAPLILQTVHFEGEVQIASGANVALNAFVVARRGRSPLDFANLVEHPITSVQSGWVPFVVELVVPPTSQTVDVGFSVTGKGLVNVRRIAIRSATVPAGPLAPEVEAYLLEALQNMRHSSLKQNSVDWDQLRDYALIKAQHAQHSSDTYDALRLALRLVDDHHSRLLVPEEVQQLMSASVVHPPEVKLTSDGIATLTIPAFDGLSARSARNYMKAAAAPLAHAAPSAGCGWVIDLRADSGGDMWPMLGVLAPFFKSGKLGAFNYLDHVDAWQLQHGVLFDGSTARVTTLKPSATLQHAKLAVLVGASTTSAGEALAIALHGRPDTRFSGRQPAALRHLMTSICWQMVRCYLSRLQSTPIDTA